MHKFDVIFYNLLEKFTGDGIRGAEVLFLLLVLLRIKTACQANLWYDVPNRFQTHSGQD